ncbi:hypothetical protein RJ640_018352 [Escallonia rubra]|uniref:non-specific serine/threonine protein kinase n=1 Tax=Escallonia rubra TaxID=112253 RepID=A0AA88S829_9ASTE|nr:hypothetical protein RJ640_018352 [Escallonia rubra]
MIRRPENRPLTASSPRDWQLGTSYSEMVQATSGFSEENLVGSGSFGSVYKGVLYGYGTVVAVKVINLQHHGASKSFMDEIKALRGIRHRNLLKIIAACSSKDHQGNPFKCIVFEFMSNGSLDQWLHPNDNGNSQTKSLDVVQRLNIAIDVASALDYLHNNCDTPIVHCDLKPSNILLDGDMTAHVGDFGLATFLFQPSNDPSSEETVRLSAGLKGSIGYIPPEYGMGGQVATAGDVYSYGILLLEMFTGKRPTDDIFKDGLGICKLVATALSGDVMEIADPSLLSGEEDNIDEDQEGKAKGTVTRKMKDGLASLFRIGLSCSGTLPGDRMPMNAVVNQMLATRDLFLGLRDTKKSRFEVGGSFVILHFRCSLMNFLLWILLLLMNSRLGSTATPSSANETDQLALLDFKNAITEDPLQVMKLWNDSLHFCNWVGVTCSPSDQRVVLLSLESQKLVGTLPPSVGNLTFLTSLVLQNNSFHGELPQELGRLIRLQNLNLSFNSFSGSIPSNLTHCTHLTSLGLNINELVGEIPNQLSSLTNLLYLGLAVNNLTGSIPAWIGNFSSLTVLGLIGNNFYGSVPYDLGRLSSLRILQLYANQLSGTLPDSIFNISSIYYFTVTQNHLQGQLPPDVGLKLPNLQFFAGGANEFSGPIPVSLSNATKLGLLDFAENRLTGGFPTNLGKLQGLYRINFDDNRLGHEEVGLNFLSYLANCKSLQVLGLHGNIFGGELPISIANLSISLERLTLGSSLLHGTIPTGIGNLISLTLLGLEENYLTGSVPDVIGKLQHLQGLALNVNRFSGQIPSSIGNLTSLTRLFMEENRLEGSIPPSLGNCPSLLVMNLSGNNLSGTIPKEVAGLSSLSISLAMAYNSLTGSLPLEVGRLVNLKELYISQNKLSGDIPSTLSSCASLETLLMEGNLLQGTIPESLGILKGTVEIDLSRNNLSGRIPEFLGKLSSLKILNLSYNNFEGEVSRKGLFANASSISVLGNDKLCGGVQHLHLPHVVETSSYGSVYKRVLYGYGAVVAVKVINLQHHGASKSFMDEIKALRDQWLHTSDDGNSQAKSLDVVQRLNIAIDVASALDYLHNHYDTPIVTPSNDPSSEETLRVSAGLKGSIGYIPPEYGMGGQVATAGDVYSYGILLLEMFTGKRPTDDIFKDGLGICKLVATALSGDVMEIADPSLLSGEEDNIDEDQEGKAKGNVTRKMKDGLASLFRIGLSCSGTLPVIAQCSGRADVSKLLYMRKLKVKRCSLMNFLLWILLLLMNSRLGSTATPSSANETDQLALLDFKNAITEDPLQVMKLWNDSLHFCNWVGVTCSPSDQRVELLNLQSQKLVGSLPPSVGNLTFLTSLVLQNNSFHGELPQELGRLIRLQNLNLSFNSFGGSIPSNLTHCTDLKSLSLNYNELVGAIPGQLNSLTNLLYLGLAVNNLTGSIPAWIGNFSSLTVLGLIGNNFYGSVPYDLGRLSSLRILQLYANQLSGTLPDSIFNISSIYYFSVTQNHLQGQLPPDVGLTLPNLQIFAGGVNEFSGPLPVSLSNASKLGVLDFAENRLTGGFPTNLGKLQGLYRINFDDNRLGHEEVGLKFLSYLANCTSLQVLRLARNLFGGELPNSIANLSTSLETLTLGSSLIHGTIPTGIGNLINLTLLGLEGNYLTGSVPDVIGKLQNLQGLYLNVNRFSGQIPSSIGNLTSLTRLFMEENRLEGSIPPSLGNCRSLLVMNLTGNNLSGTIPKEVAGLSSLSISLAMAHNSLTGSLPLEVGRLVNLKELYISQNKLSGDIPSTLSSCASLETLLMEGNLLQGTIPESLGNLKGIVEIDLSHNNLSGRIPEFLGKLSSLKILNLSYNNFEGEVPRSGVFANASSASVLGNDKLCGGVQDLHLPHCSGDKSRQSKEFLSLKVVIPVTASFILVIILCFSAACYVIRRTGNGPLTASSTSDWQLGTSYSEMVQATSGFSEENLVGSGSFGSVYKGVLYGDGAVVAVKVINLQHHGASKSFTDETRALRGIRHRNLLKIISACSSKDHQGNPFKCIVSEFMSNGSLDQWLHPSDNGNSYTKSLDIMQRLNIAIDVASALDYLHNYCETPIVHCDLKPSNILLDDDMTAHVGDFGLATVLFQPSNDPSSKENVSVGLKGSIGYIPPEYGMGGQVATTGDVYSYGILLLEMFTGKRPTDDIFNGLEIRKLVATAFSGDIMEIADPLLLSGEKDDIDKDQEEKVEGHVTSRMKDGLASLFRIGLSCSSTLPGDRMPMKVVVNQMLATRDLFLGLKDKNKRRLEVDKREGSMASRIRPGTALSKGTSPSKSLKDRLNDIRKKLSMYFESSPDREPVKELEARLR